MRRRRGSFWVALPLLVLISMAGCAEDNSTEPPPDPGENAFVGALACVPCHGTIYQQSQASGHPHKITPVVNGQKPGAPLILPDNPPAGLAWSDVKYVIGGWGWKARFVTQEMQVVVGEGVQYNIPTEQFPEAAWANYNVGKPTAFNFDCFRCHTTGPDQATNTFNQPGIQCESCHGMGKHHVNDPSKSNIVADDSAEACGQCHYRDEAKVRIIAGGGFINHHEQYEEMKDGGHAGLKCVTCHDYHVGIRRGQVGGIVKQCTSCHSGLQVNHMGGNDCIACHMGRATKSARAVNKYVGDVATHIFAIHDGPEDQSTMFETVGTVTYVKQGYGVTLDFACYSCHKDENGVGGSASTKTLAELYAKAPLIHGAGALASQ